MNLLQMSFSGAILTMAVIVVRAVFINKLPKRTFLVLWGIVLLRLLIPFSIPSVLSVYSLVSRSTPVKEIERDVMASDFIPTAQTGQLFIDNSTSQTQMLQGNQDNAHVSVWIIIWCVGTIFCVAFFIVSYLRFTFEFKTSLPVSNNFIIQWLEEHRLKRTITIRQSNRIETPLTYGILHPVILMPEKTDWENKQQLQYILLHEYVHICRYDIATKLISALALCIHWFNPMVWAMYILFNRDIELACDECVIRKFGVDSKSEYALTLISMEEKKSGLIPICNNFSKNAIEERITAVMKIKKTSFAAIIVAVVLVTSVTTAFATSAIKDDKRSTEISDTDFSDEEYEELLALQFDGYVNDINYTDEWREELQNEADRILTPYVQFGLTYQYDFSSDDYMIKMYFQGKEVRGIYDERENFWFSEHAGIGEGIYGDDAVELYVVYENDEMAGLRIATEQEQKEWSNMRQQTTDEWKNAQKTGEYPYAAEEDCISIANESLNSIINDYVRIENIVYTGFVEFSETPTEINNVQYYSIENECNSIDELVQLMSNVYTETQIEKILSWCTDGDGPLIIEYEGKLWRQDAYAMGTPFVLPINEAKKVDKNTIEAVTDLDGNEDFLVKIILKIEGNKWKIDGIEEIEKEQ